MDYEIHKDIYAVEVFDIESRPIDGVRYETITTRVGDSGEKLAFLFELKKYGMRLDILLPKEYPSVPPEAYFVEPGIPSHPNVDSQTGYVRGMWSSGPGWSSDTRIRDICARVMTMLAEAKTPASPPRAVDEEVGFRFPVTISEFTYLCKFGEARVQELRSRYCCSIKYRYKKKNRAGPPHILIRGSSQETESLVAAALDQYLVREGVRRFPKAKRIDPEPDPVAFVSNFMPSPLVAAVEEDLMQFNDDEPLQPPAYRRAETKSISPFTRPNVQAAPLYEHYQPGGVRRSARIGDGDGSGVMPACGRNENCFRNDYSQTEMRELVEKVKRAFGALDTQQSRKFSALGEATNYLYWKINALGELLPSLISSFADNTNTIEAQRQVINEKRAEERSLRNSLEKYSCGICMNRSIDTMLNCGHGFCQQCANTQSFCPFCRHQIQSMSKLYL